MISVKQEEYNRKFTAMRERGVQVGDILICDEGARPIPHYHTKRLHVRVTPYDIIDGTGPRFFIHGLKNGLVAYIPDFVQDSDNTQVIQPGAKFQVIKKLDSSIILREVKET